MQTFPGGIHSGTDFYMNDAGIVIGETTVLQTPFDAEGTPQSNRIRKAIQYGSSVDEVAALLREKNNGMYTNDWTLADVKRDEAAILLLGTGQSKLWRSTDQPAPFGTPGFLWANNNARDAGVRREVAAQPEDAPCDSTFTPGEPRPGLPALLRGAQGQDRRAERGAAHGLLADQPAARVRRQGDRRADGREARLHGPPGQGDAAREVPRGGQPPDARPAGRGPAPDLRLRDVQPDRHRRAAEGRARGAGRGEGAGARHHRDEGRRRPLRLHPRRPVARHLLPRLRRRQLARGRQRRVLADPARPAGEGRRPARRARPGARRPPKPARLRHRRARRTSPRRRAASPTTATRRLSSRGSRAPSPSTSCAFSPGTRRSSPS